MAPRACASTHGGAETTAQIEALNDAGRTLSYCVPGGGGNYDDYLATIRVRDVGSGRTKVRWDSTFTPKGVPAEVCAMFEGLYREAIGNLAYVRSTRTG
ncbi:MAG: SRPBCC family protein [Nitrospirota bacterium]|nr:SRPBCC family protein [Nitrospirota bacterium]